MERRWFTRSFSDLSGIYPDRLLECDSYAIYKGALTHEDLDELRTEKGTFVEQTLDEFVVGKPYVCLLHKEAGELMMSDHPSETQTNEIFLASAFGDVLVFGLGLGMIIYPLLDDPNIRSILVVEKDQGLIDLVGPYIHERDRAQKFRVVQDDAFAFHGTLNEKKFDTIYFDIWIEINQTAFMQMNELHKLYKPFLRHDSGYIDSWCYHLRHDYC